MACLLYYLSRALFVIQHWWRTVWEISRSSQLIIVLFFIFLGLFNRTRNTQLTPRCSHVRSKCSLFIKIIAHRTICFYILDTWILSLSYFLFILGTFHPVTVCNKSWLRFRPLFWAIIWSIIAIIRPSIWCWCRCMWSAFMTALLSWYYCSTSLITKSILHCLIYETCQTLELMWLPTALPSSPYFRMMNSTIMCCIRLISLWFRFDSITCLVFIHLSFWICWSFCVIC